MSAGSGLKGADDPRGLIRRRLGEAVMRKLAIDGQEVSGAELQSAGLALPVVPRMRVEERALALARSIARAPRGALAELKRHMRRDPLMPGDAMPAAEPLRAFASTGEGSYRA